jgi:hypothetical protein
MIINFETKFFIDSFRGEKNSLNGRSNCWVALRNPSEISFWKLSEGLAPTFEQMDEYF